MISRNKREGHFIPGWGINLKPNFQKANVRTGAGNGICRYKTKDGQMFFWPTKQPGTHSGNATSYYADKLC